MLLHEKFKNHQIILASQSPRRKQLLEGIGINFITRPLDIDEQFPTKLKREEIAIFLAKAKADEARKNAAANEIFITADTIVWLNNQVLNKPADENEARRMLHQLSGKMHEVITAVSITSTKKSINFYSIAEVFFKHLSIEEINYYIEKFKPFDKAGAYGVQEWIGYVAVEKINGSFYNVMGLPTKELAEELLAF